MLLGVDVLARAVVNGVVAVDRHMVTADEIGSVALDWLRV